MQMHCELDEVDLDDESADFDLTVFRGQPLAGNPDEILAPALDGIRFAYAQNGEDTLYAEVCHACNARGYVSKQQPNGLWRLHDCHHCDGAGCTGVIPELPSIAPPGTMERVLVMAARYQAGLPIWKADDETKPRPGKWHTIIESNGRTIKTRRRKTNILDSNNMNLCRVIEYAPAHEMTSNAETLEDDDDY